jgi:hypothetical protein
MTRIQIARRLTILGAAAAIAVLAPVDHASATRSDLVAFLERSERMVSHTRAVRADLTITTSDGSTSKAVAIVDPKGERVFYAAGKSWRALAPLKWNATGKVSTSTDAKPTSFGPDDRLGDTDLRPIDFFPFWAVADYGSAFVSDNTRLEKTVTLYAPDENPYMLFVLTFDKEKIVPVIVKYFSGQMNNMARIRTDSDHVMVGARPRPRKIVINNYEDNISTTYKIDWKLLESIPQGLFDDSTFYTAALDQ